MFCSPFPLTLVIVVFEIISVMAVGVLTFFKNHPLKSTTKNNPTQVVSIFLLNKAVTLIFKRLNLNFTLIISIIEKFLC